MDIMVDGNNNILIDIAETVGRIEGKLDGCNMRLDRIELPVAEIPALKAVMTNHLAHHEKRIKYFWYPISVALTLGIIGFLLKVIFHAF